MPESSAQGSGSAATPSRIDAAKKRTEGFRGLYPYEPHFLDAPLPRPDKATAALHYLDEGRPSGDGATILCVHGNPTWSFYWRAIVEGCRGTSRVVVPDHLGMGLSDRVPGGVQLAEHIAALVALIDELDLKEITLVVHDWGGAIGFGAAVQRPERFARFVVTNTSAFPSSFMPTRIAACRAPLVGRLAVQGGNAFARAATKQTTVVPLPADVRRGLLAPYSNWAEREQVWRFVADIPMSEKHASWPALSAIADGLAGLRDRPMEIVWGMRDWCFTPAFLAEWRERFPDAEVSELEGAGHYVNEDAPEAVIAAIRRLHRPLTQDTEQIRS